MANYPALLTEIAVARPHFLQRHPFMGYCVFLVRCTDLPWRDEPRNLCSPDGGSEACTDRHRVVTQVGEARVYYGAASMYDGEAEFVCWTMC